MSGADILVQILKAHNFSCVITVAPPDKGNYYDPKERTIYLRKPVYAGKSLQGLAITCHEFGHLLQHVTGYKPFLFSRAIGKRSYALNVWLEWDASRRALGYLRFFMGPFEWRMARTTLYKLFLTHLVPAIFFYMVYATLIYFLIKWL